MSYQIACVRSAGSRFGAAGPRPLLNGKGKVAQYATLKEAAQAARDLMDNRGSLNVAYYPTTVWPAPAVECTAEEHDDTNAECLCARLRQPR